MKTVLRTVAKKLSANKLVAAFLLLTTVTAIGMSSVASAARAPGYFAVEKPTSQSVCYGGTWDWDWDWSWHRWHWERTKSWFWTPNWERLGFESRAHCLTYVSTPKPVSKEQCRQEWWSLGFGSKSQCNLYLRLHPGGGYGGGNPQQG